MSASLEPLLEAARAAQRNAYSPYSGYNVGSAIALSTGEIYAGCNVENASYGGTMCAERGAIYAAVTAHGAIYIAEVLVLSSASPPWPPCGLCRQVIAEFATPDCVVHCANDQGEVVTTPFEAIFPQSFDKRQLQTPAT